MATFPTSGVEVLDGIEKRIKSSRYVVAQDNEAYSDGMKTETEVVFDEPVINIRVQDDSLAAVMSFLEGDRTVLHRFNLPGYNHFNRDDDDNYAYVVTHSAPVPVSANRWDLSITVIWQADP